MASLKLRWTLPAFKQLREARLYVEAENPHAAPMLGKRIEDGMQRLTLFPEMGRVGRRAGTRELVIPGTPLIVTYRITADTVEVLSVIHGARRWAERL